MSSGSSGGASGAREEEMEEVMEIEEGSNRTVSIPAARGTFIAGTADGTVTEVRNSQKRQRTAVNVSEDLLNRQIQDYGLVSGGCSGNLDMTISSCNSKPCARSVLGTRTDVVIVQCNWAKTIRRLP